MHRTRPKISRRELKGPGEFTVLAEKATGFVARNRRRLAALAAALVVAAAATGGIAAYLRHQRRLAADEFAGGLGELAGGRPEQALADFARAADRPGSGALGEAAQFYVARCYIAQSQLARAIAELQNYLASGRDPLVREMAFNALAAAFERSGHPRRAEQAYAQAAKLAGPEKRDAQLNVARLLAEQAKRPEAIRAYRRFLGEYPFSRDRWRAAASLAQMGAPLEKPQPKPKP